MAHIFQKYRLQMIKESSTKYDLNNTISIPEDIEHIAREILELDKNAEEVFCIMALDTKNKVIGLTEVSRGTINNTIVNPREVCKRLLLMNAIKYIALHNHPSGRVEPSEDDIQICNILSNAGKMIDIELLDFCIIGDGFLSFKRNNLM